MRLLGVLSRLTYRLSRHRFLRLPLDLVIVLAALAALVYALVGAVGSGKWVWAPGVLVALALWGAVLLAMRLSSFVLFRPAAQSTLVDCTLEPFESVPLRASGVFEVGEQRCYYVEAPGWIEATEFGERVLMVEVKPLTLLGLFGSREEEWGWWYIFFRPEELEAVASGRLYFGRRPRPALRLQRRGQDRPLAYLSFDHARPRDRVAADLRSTPAGSVPEAPSS